jgi:hypothetical protein
VVPAAKPGALLNQIEQACRANDAAATRRLLLAWAAARWPQDAAPGFGFLAQRLGGEIAPVLQQLDQSLYSATAQPWDGVAAWGRLSVALRNSTVGDTSGRGKPALPDLYPQGV